MTGEALEARLDRWLALVEAKLRKDGMTERGIKAKRPTIRAQLMEHLRTQEPK